MPLASTVSTTSARLLGDGRVRYPPLEVWATVPPRPDLDTVRVPYPVPRATHSQNRWNRGGALVPAGSPGHRSHTRGAPPSTTRRQDLDRAAGPSAGR